VKGDGKCLERLPPVPRAQAEHADAGHRPAPYHLKLKSILPDNLGITFTNDTHHDNNRRFIHHFFFV
jgi:hypothetical protein